MGYTMALPGVKGRARCPRETDEAKTLAAWMDAKRLCYCHVPNGGYSLGGNRFAQASKLRAEGLKTGVPDYLIFDPPPSRPECPGAALELKRRTGSKVSDEQREWIEALTIRGWAVTVARGADEAIEWLRGLGY